MNIFLYGLSCAGIVLGVLLALVLLILFFMLLRGYIFYLKYGGSRQLKKRIAELRSAPDFKELKDISPSLTMCLIALEDGDFYLHKGINFRMFYKSMKYNIKNRKLYLGGSSLTQQLSKNLLFPFRKVIRRKVAELFAVRILEKNCTKNEILELYINCIEYGENCYGITNAAAHYTGKTPEHLSFSESLQIISLLPAPKRYAPEKDLMLFLKARENAMAAMLRKGLLLEEDYALLSVSAPFEAVLPDHIEKLYNDMASIAIKKQISLEKPMLLEHSLFHRAFKGTFCEKELAEYARNIAESQNTIYCWGCLMNPLSAELIAQKKKAYPDWYTEDKCQKILNSGKNYGCDCSGLIKSYLFQDGYDSFFDFNSSMFLSYATEKGPISTLPERTGICLFMEGHVGIYLGNGQVVEATNNARYGDGVLLTELDGRGFSHWFSCPLVIQK